jgi:hypothetical protein
MGRAFEIGILLSHQSEEMTHVAGTVTGGTGEKCICGNEYMQVSIVQTHLDTPSTVA